MQSNQTDTNPTFDTKAPMDDIFYDEASAADVKFKSHDQMALEYAIKYKGSLKYMGQWGKWLVWNGHKWEIDNRMVFLDKCRLYLRSVAKQMIPGMVAARIAKVPNDLMTPERARQARQEVNRIIGGSILHSSTIYAVAGLSRSDQMISINVDHLDADPWLLNTPDGFIDLKTGQLNPHDPLKFMTKCTKVGPRAGVPELWLSFLHKIMHGSAEMVGYLQKVFGYCLVGSTKEHQMYFGYGTGANGKGVTLNTLRNLLGDYGVEAAIETFILTQSSRHPTELADLRGARLVTCGETDEGQRWAEARIKMLTGGDPVKARFMRQDFFTYQPQFKLFLAGNHKPRLQNVDEAIERRFRLIPFTYTVPKLERDTDLADKLIAEWPMILQWAIDGCLKWQREGLDAPTNVTAATKEYLSQEDAVSGWFAESCESCDAAGFVYIKDLFDSWREWASNNGEQIGTKRQLTQMLDDRSPVLKIQRVRRTEGFGFSGVALKSPPSENSD